jgi:argininosuccinate synthase
MSDHEFAPRTAAYQADPAEVHRVLLLYSGGLDTSVMLRWIQERYEAEVVTLTVNLGQPGEDYAVIEGKARQIGAVECHIVDAREEFANEYLAPAIKANALYGGGYPLFTALGRPLIAKLAVEYARRSGCDTIAHGCTGKGNDQVRIDGTIATLAPELKVIAPVREWAMGREEEIAYAREHGIPVKGGLEVVLAGAGSRTSPTRLRRTSSSSSPRRGSRPISRRGSICGSSSGCRSRSTGSSWRWPS